MALWPRAESDTTTRQPGARAVGPLSGVPLGRTVPSPLFQSRSTAVVSQHLPGLFSQYSVPSPPEKNEDGQRPGFVAKGGVLGMMARGLSDTLRLHLMSGKKGEWTTHTAHHYRRAIMAMWLAFKEHQAGGLPDFERTSERLPPPPST